MHNSHFDIPFNVPFIHPDVANYMQKAAKENNFFRNQGYYYQQVQKIMSKWVGHSRIFPTPSCTQALEIASMIIDIQHGDEIILPSYTYASTANAFVLRGAKLVFADVLSYYPSLDPKSVEACITPKTKAIVWVHYGGRATRPEEIITLSNKYNITLIEDAAHAIGATHNNRPLGTFGDMSAISFHETKNIGCAQGGALIINQHKWLEKAMQHIQCGTNRHDFISGKINAYKWMREGTNGILAEPLCAMLSCQLHHLETVTRRRKKLWNHYYHLLSPITEKGIQICTPDKEDNAHVFYLMLPDKKTCTHYQQTLKEKGIHSATHYEPLHLSPFMQSSKLNSHLPNTDKFGISLLRLPLHHYITEDQQQYVANQILDLTFKKK